jgi:hypothetical protein
LFIHYTRNKYNLILKNDDVEYKTITNIPFEKNLSEYEIQATNPGNIEGYTFSGWFEDTA